MANTNSMALGKFEFNCRKVILKLILAIGDWGIPCEIVHRCMSLGFTVDRSTLVQVMAWCRQVTSHYLNQWWAGFCRHMVSLGPNESKKIYGEVNLKDCCVSVVYLLRYTSCPHRSQQFPILVGIQKKIYGLCFTLSNYGIHYYENS